jgi:uncharacterized damage-inducible protein DinB
MTDSSEYLSDASIRERLEAERQRLRERLAAIPAELQGRRPSADRWSIAEVVEHLARIEGGVTKMLSHFGAAAPAGDVAPPAMTAHATPELGRRVRHRGTRIEAPERVRPGGGLDGATALAQLESARQALLAAFAAANRDALDVHTWPHPVFGPLTLRSWVSFTADHEARHSAQIAEIAEQLGATVA